MYQILCLLCLMPVTDCLVYETEMRTGTPIGRRSCSGRFLPGVDYIFGWGLVKASTWNFTATFEIKTKASNCFEQVCFYNLSMCIWNERASCFCRNIPDSLEYKGFHYKMLAASKHVNSTIRFSYQDGQKTGHGPTKKMPPVAMDAKESLFVNNEKISFTSNSCKISLSYTSVGVLRYCVENLDPDRNISIRAKVLKITLKDMAKSHIPCVNIKVQLCQYDPEAVTMEVSDIVYLGYQERSGCKRKNATKCLLTSHGKTKKCLYLPLILRHPELISGNRTLKRDNQASHVEHFQQLTIFLFLLAIFKTAFP